MFFIKKNNYLKKYGLCKPNYTSKYFLFYVPLFILISTNIWFGITNNFNFLESLLNVLTMLCVGFVEEIIFRGFLFVALAKNNVKSAIIISSVTFGIGHLVNLFTNGLENIVPNICQVFYAMAVGFLFVIIIPLFILLIMQLISLYKMRKSAKLEEEINEEINKQKELEEEIKKKAIEEYLNSKKD